MKPIPLPSPVLGLDVRSPESNLPRGAVRRATNVVLSDKGDFRRAPGSVLRGALSGAHSLWRSASGITLAGAGATLYEVTLGSTTTFDAIFVGLPYDEPIEYCEVGADIYFAARGVLGKLCADGLVRRPGVADLLGFTPTLSPTVGGLYEGRYGVAYSLTNDLGEESPLSSISYIDLPTGGGIMLANLVIATDATKVNVYVTPANGRELYLNTTIPWATATSVTDQYRGRQPTKMGRVPMPGGSIVRHKNGRLYVAAGNFVLISDAYDLGVHDPSYGWLALQGEVTMLEPVAGGLFVGTADRVVFYPGGGPEDFKPVTVSSWGAAAHSGTLVPADYFEPKLIGDAGLPVAVWLSDVGLTVGTADGRIVPVQADRIRLTSEGQARAAAVWNGGVKQLIFSVESMTMGVGGSADGTP